METAKHLDDVPFHALQRRFDCSVAGAAERLKVVQGVRIPVVRKEPIGAYVMDIRAGGVALLARAAVPATGRPLLRQPVRAAVVLRAADELGVQFADAGGVLADAAPEFAGTGLAGDLRWAAVERGRAPDAGKTDLRARRRLAGRVLTPWRA